MKRILSRNFVTAYALAFWEIGELTDEILK